MAKGSQREGYQVGVFKDGKLKHIMKLQEGQHYIREKTKKIKESKPKRECSKAQLEALARGRALREEKRGGGGGSKKGGSSSLRGQSGKSIRKISAPKVKPKNVRYAKDQKSQTKKKQTKARLRREKEMNEGKHRSHESQYTSDSDHSDGLSRVDYDDDEVTE